MTPSLDDMFGTSPKPTSRLSSESQRRINEHRSRLASPVGADLEESLPDDEHEAYGQALQSDGIPDPRNLKRPMTLTNIATLLGKEPRRTAGLLANCPTVGTVKQGRYAGAPLYDLKDAINYIATPLPSHVATWFRSQSSSTLPPILNKAMWEAERIKTKVKYEAGELWHTTDVQRVFGLCAKTISEHMLLWVEKLPNAQQMTTEQYDGFRRQVISLQEEIYQIMIELPRQQQTRSYVETIEKLEDSEGLDEVG